MNLAQVLQLKYPDANFEKDILLADYGKGPVIQKWALAGVAKPSNKQIAQFKLDMQSTFDSNRVRDRREAAYKAAGVTMEALTVAMMEDKMENRPDALSALQAIRVQIKKDIPK